MSSPPPAGQSSQQRQGGDSLAGRSSSPLAFPSSSPRRGSANAAGTTAGNGSSPRDAAGHTRGGQLGIPTNNHLPRSSSPLAFPSSSPRRAANSQAATPQASNTTGNPLFAPDSATRGSSRGSALRNVRNSSSVMNSDPAAPSSEPLFFPSSATPKARRARGDIHSSLPLSPSPLRRRGADQDGQAVGGAPSSSAPDGNGSLRFGTTGRQGAPPSLSNVGLSSDALEENERNQGARTVIWNTAVSLDETMSTFKMFLQEFKAKYRTEYARKLGKPLPFVPDPERPVYEH